MLLNYLAYETININPNNNLPGTAQITALVGGLVTWMLYACGAAILLGAGAWGLGHHSGNYAAEHKGRSMALGGVIGAMVAGAASALVNFGCGVGASVVLVLGFLNPTNAILGAIGRAIRRLSALTCRVDRSPSLRRPRPSAPDDIEARLQGARHGPEADRRQTVTLGRPMSVGGSARGECRA